MADLEVQCEACDGRRFQSHILAIRFNGRNINEVLALTVDEARGFFAQIAGRDAPAGAARCGRPRLSCNWGRPPQRCRAARPSGSSSRAFCWPTSNRCRRPTTASRWAAMFLLDEPTTGLASSDIKQLLRVLVRLVAEGNTLVVIEHNLEFIAQADYIIDLGPGGGDEGGRVVAAGDPLKVAAAASRGPGASCGGCSACRRARRARRRVRPSCVRAPDEVAAQRIVSRGDADRLYRRPRRRNRGGASALRFVETVSRLQSPVHSAADSHSRAASANAEEPPHSGSPLVIRLGRRSK